MNKRFESFRLNTPLGAGAMMIAVLALIAAAGPPSNPKIGVVDTKRIAAESKTVRGMISGAASKAETLKAELEKSKGEYSSRLEAYSAQKSVIADEEKSRREEAIQSLRDEIEVLEIRLNRELKRSQEGMVGPMGVKILGAIREVSKDMGLTVVFTTDDVVHYDATCDITGAVIKKLDK